MAQVRKWVCVFDGRDPIAFLERIAELKTGYRCSGEYMLCGLPELLKGDVLLWYRNSSEDWASWGDFEKAFRNQFIPRDYERQLRRDIVHRHQRCNELYAQYEISLLTMMRRMGGYTTTDKLLQLYENLDPDYKLYVRKETLTYLTDLRNQATEYEAVLRQQRERRRDRDVTPRPALAATFYDRNICCWRCKQRGHNRQQCRRPTQIFCSQCGQDGVFTRDCHPPAGNEPRVEATSAIPRP